MKYEEIKVDESYYIDGEEHKVIHKQDESKAVFTLEVGSDDAYGWNAYQLKMFKPLSKKLPEEGLLVSRSGSLVYRLSGDSGYGFTFSRQSEYCLSNWGFSVYGYWQPATLEQEERFIEMIKKECESRGLFEDTKIEYHAKDSASQGLLNQGVYSWESNCKKVWNKNGVIFYKGNFATPRKEKSDLEKITEALKDVVKYEAEEIKSGAIILTPLKD